MIEDFLFNPIVNLIFDALTVFAGGVAFKILQDRAAEKINQEIVDPMLERAIALVHSKEWWQTFDDIRELNPAKDYRELVKSVAMLLQVPLMVSESWAKFVDEVKTVDKHLYP